MGSNDISALEQKFANIIEFEKRYQTDIEKCIKVKSKPWSNNFQKGRLLFQLKKMDESWRTLKKIELGKIPFIFILKIAYMALIIKYGTIFPNEKH